MKHLYTAEVVVPVCFVVDADDQMFGDCPFDELEDLVYLQAGTLAMNAAEEQSASSLKARESGDWTDAGEQVYGLRRIRRVRDIPPYWRDAIPWFVDDGLDTTCAEFVRQEVQP